MAEGSGPQVRQRIGVAARCPRRAYYPRLARELILRLGNQPIVESAARDQNDKDNENADDEQRPEQEPLGEPHAVERE